MPVVAIIPAIAAVSSVGMAGFGAVLAGTATLGTTFAAIGAVGATLGAIGEIAGVKELKTAGLVLGGIGGVGSLASAVGAFGEGATINSVFGSAGAATSEAGAATSGATGPINGGFNQVSDSADDILGVGAFSGANAGGTSEDVFDAINHIGGFNQTSDSADDILGAGAFGGGGSPSGAQKVVDNTKVLAKKATSPDNTTEGPTNADNAPSSGTSTNTAATKNNAAAATGKVNGPPGDASSWKLGEKYEDENGGSWSYDGKQWTKTPSFWGSNASAMLGVGVVQAAGSFLSGATDELKPARIKAYEAQAAANNAQAALAQKELGNMNSNIPTARRINVTGGVGLINR